MTTLDHRHGQALLVVDLQHGVVAGAYQRDDVIATVVDLVDRARSARVPVIWVQHHDHELAPGTAAWQWVPELRPADGEPLIEKTYGDAFADTTLEQTLAGLAVGEIVLVGAATEQCIRCTMHSAVVRGYDVALVKGGHTTVDLTEYGLPEPAVVVAFLDSIASFGMEWPGRRARSVTPDSLDF